jgi:hypothetical protein
VTEADAPRVDTVMFEAAADVTFTPEEWQTRVANVAAMLDSNGLTPADLRAALEEQCFTDSERRVWRYDGASWFWQSGDQWLPAQPAAPLWLRPWAMRWMVPADDAPDVAPQPSAPTFAPTHRVGTVAQPTWPEPDPTAAPGPPLPAGLEVQVTARRGDWAEIVASNGWSAWVDHRLLISL